MSWSGGQYSLARAVLACALIAHFGQELTPDRLSQLTLEALAVVGPTALWFCRGLGLALAAMLLVGRFDRAASFALFFLLPLPVSASLLQPLVNPLALLVLVHALTPAAPYGSLAALGRPSPAGNWQFPRYLHHILWLFLGATMITSLLAAASSSRPLGELVLTALQALACLLALSGRLRPLSFLILAGTLPLLPVLGHSLDPALLVLLLMAFDPAWLPPLRTATPELLFYDGQCGLCHRACRFVLAEDRDGELFAFAPLQGETFAARLRPEQRRDLPDSIVVLTEDGRLLTRTSALIHLGHRLGGLWRPLAFSARLIPRPLRDAAYAGLAAIRHRLFASPKDLCPLIPADLRPRFRP